MKLSQLQEARYASDWKRSRTYEYIQQQDITHEISKNRLNKFQVEVMLGPYYEFDDVAQVYDEVIDLERQKIKVSFSSDEDPEEPGKFWASLYIEDPSAMFHPGVERLVKQYGSDEGWDGCG